MNIFKQCCCLSLVIALQWLTPASAYAEDYENAQQAQLNEGELAQMLAPIALYPDSLLTHILIAATYPLEVVEAQRWQQKNQQLSTEKQVSNAQSMQWDPSVIALIAFPTVLQKLSEDLQWTQSLGDAFLQDEAQVLASIQALRQQADNANNLNDMENMQVTRVNNQIVIEPVRKEIVYVPYYDPRVVYGSWYWYNYPPVYWAMHPGYVRPRYGHFYWHTGVHISFNYYFSAFHWHKHHVVVVHHKNSRHYRHRGRIVTSHGAKRWAHKPQHRRGVAYSNNALRHKYKSHNPSRAHSKTLRTQKPYKVNKSREMQFTKNLKQQPKVRNAHYGNNKAMKSHQRVKSHQPVNSKQRVNSHQPVNSQQRINSHQPVKSQQRVNRHQSVKSQQRVKSHQQVNSRQPGKSHQQVKSHQQAKSYQPQKSYRQAQSHKPTNSHRGSGHKQRRD